MEAVDFIERTAPTGEPFFLYLPLHAPHVPLVPSGDFDGQTGLGKYADVVVQMDWTVGQVLDALDQVGARDNTLVIFASDNGSFIGDIPVPNHVDHHSNGMWRGGKKEIYEGGHRVPLLMRWPVGIESGSAVSATVSLTDLYATLADIVGEAPSAGVATDSVSLLPLLRGETETRGVPVVHHSYGGMFALRDGCWKLVFGSGNGRGDHIVYVPPVDRPFALPWQLYDLEDDPRERRNLVEARPEEVTRLEAALARIRAAEDGMLSGDATLRSLRIAGIDIEPFDSDVRSYEAIVSRSIETVRVTAHPTDTDASVYITTRDGRRLYRKYSYGRYPHGQAKIKFAEDATTITAGVTAPDNSATASYTVTLIRPGLRITGRVQVDETLTADTSGINDADGLTNAVLAYQWVRNDGNADRDIAGATGERYIPRDADEGKTILVRVSFTDDWGNEETQASQATTTVAPPNNAPVGAPIIRGTGRVGETLTADTSGITDANGLTNATFAYQWLSGDRDIGGATGSSYTLGYADEGKSIRVRVSFTDDAGNDEALTSESGFVAWAPPSRPEGLRAIAGGGTVVLNWNAPDDAHKVARYHILRHRPEEGEPEPLVYVEYTGTDVEPGVLHVYRVKGANFFGFVGEASDPASIRVPSPNRPATGSPTISGTAQMGETLTTDISDVSDEDGLDDSSFRYQWLADDADIPGATGSTYTLAAGDEGKAIRVRVSFTDDAGNEETLTSEPTAVVSAAPTPLTAEFLDTPSSHDGQTFMFELRVSEEFPLSYRTLQEGAFTVTGGELTGVRRLEPGSNQRWKISVRPSNNGGVAITLPETTGCNADGAICTEDGRRLSNRNELTVSGPG